MRHTCTTATQCLPRRVCNTFSHSLHHSGQPWRQSNHPIYHVDLHITNLCYAHDIAIAVFNEYDQTNKALRQILIATVDKMLIHSLRHPYVGYGITTTRTILEHLCRPAREQRQALSAVQRQLAY